MPTIVRKEKKAIINPIEDFGKFRDKRKERLAELVDKYDDWYGAANDNGVEYLGDKDVVKILTAEEHGEDREGLVNFLADVDAYRAKYGELGRHLKEAASNSKLESESEGGLHNFLEEIARTADHKEFVGRNPQDFYGKLIRAGAKLEMKEEEIGELWYDAQKNNPDGRKARAKIVDILIGDLLSDLIRSSLDYSTKHLNDADYGRLDSYKLIVGKAARVLSHGHYAPNFDKLRTLQDIKSELGSNVLNYSNNIDAPHHKNPKASVHYLKTPEDFKSDDVGISDIRKVANDTYKLKRTA